MLIGTHVKVTAGEHHGKTGHIASVNLKGSGDHTRAIPTVRLSNGLEIEISGADLKVVR